MARMLIGLAGLFASCGWTQPTAEPQTPPAASAYDPLVIAVGYDLYSVMSVATDSALDETIIEATTFPMLDFDFDCRIESRPALVTDWAWSEGGTVLSMTLRSDISFSDGDRVTAEDVALTYQLAADPSLQSPHEGQVMRMSPGEGPRVIDDTHLRWRFTEPYNRALQLDQATSLGILPAHLLGKMDRPTVLQYAGVLPPLASGPWAMSDHVPNVGFTLTPNPQFTGPDTWRPTLDGVEFRILPDYGARLEALETGDVHVMTQVKFEDANTLAQAHPEITLYRRSSQSIDYVAWNTERPLFADARVRQALTLAIDIDAIIASELTSVDGTPYATRATSTISPDLCDLHNPDVQLLPHDPQRALTVLAEAGWTDTDGDGTLDRGGLPFSFELVTVTGNPRRAATLAAIARDLGLIGIHVDVAVQPSGAFFERLRLRDYDAAISGWSPSLFVDPEFLWHSDVTCDGSGPECRPARYDYNFTGYSNPVVDDLLRRGSAASLPEVQAPIWRELQQVIYSDQPYTFLWWNDEIVAVNNRFDPGDNVNLISPYDDLHEWRRRE